MQWVTNTEGKPDSMLTLAIVSLGVILVKFLLSEVSFGPIIFGQLDGTVVAAILTPTLGAYVARRHSDNVTQQNKDKNENVK